VKIFFFSTAGWHAGACGNGRGMIGKGMKRFFFWVGDRGGDTEVVKENLKKLAKHHAAADIAVYWHKYNDDDGEKGDAGFYAIAGGIG